MHSKLWEALALILKQMEHDIMSINVKEQSEEVGEGRGASFPPARLPWLEEMSAIKEN